MSVDRLDKFKKVSVTRRCANSTSAYFCGDEIAGGGGDLRCHSKGHLIYVPRVKPNRSHI